MGEPSPTEAAKMLRSMARGAGMGLIPGHNHDAMALAAGADALEQLQALRDRHAALEVHTTLLHDLLDRASMFMPWPQSERPKLTRLHTEIHAALRTPPPAAGQAILDEVTRLRVETAKLRSHLFRADPHHQDAIQQALDQAVPQEGSSPRFHVYDDGGGGAGVQCHNCSSDATHFEPDTGWTCSSCGASDADE